MVKTKTKKVKKVTMTEAKAEAARLGLQVADKYDKRYLNTWLYTIGEKEAKKPLTMAELIALAKENAVTS